MSVHNALTVVLMFQIFNLIDIGYMPIIGAYLLNFLFGFIIAVTVEVIKRAYHHIDSSTTSRTTSSTNSRTTSSTNN